MLLQLDTKALENVVGYKDVYPFYPSQDEDPFEWTSRLIRFIHAKNPALVVLHYRYTGIDPDIDTQTHRYLTKVVSACVAAGRAVVYIDDQFEIDAAGRWRIHKKWIDQVEDSLTGKDYDVSYCRGDMAFGTNSEAMRAAILDWSSTDSKYHFPRSTSHIGDSSFAEIIACALDEDILDREALSLIHI